MPYNITTVNFDSPESKKAIQEKVSANVEQQTKTQIK